MLTHILSIVRASLGAMTTKGDIQALLLFLHNEFVVESDTRPLSLLEPSPSEHTFRLPLREMAGNNSLAGMGYLREV